jgi:hypothetical protein
MVERIDLQLNYQIGKWKVVQETFTVILELSDV